MYLFDLDFILVLMESYILLENIELHAHHGVFEQENITGNTFIINLKIKTDLSQASVSDDLDDTINYGLVFDAIKSEMGIPSKLLEYVAGRIIRRLRISFPSIERIELKISKKNPPVDGQVEQSSILLID